MWMAAPRSTGWSSEPPLTLSTSQPGPSCHSREPQTAQNWQWSVRPLSVRRDQVLDLATLQVEMGLGHGDRDAERRGRLLLALAAVADIDGHRLGGDGVGGSAALAAAGQRQSWHSSCLHFCKYTRPAPPSPDPRPWLWGSRPGGMRIATTPPPISTLRQERKTRSNGRYPPARSPRRWPCGSPSQGEGTDCRRRTTRGLGRRLDRVAYQP